MESGVGTGGLVRDASDLGALRIGMHDKVIGSCHLQLQLVILHVESSYLGQIWSENLIILQLVLDLWLVFNDLALIVGLMLHYELL